MLEHLGLGIVLTMQDDFTPQANKAMQSMDMFENQVEVMTKNVSRAMNNLQNLMLAGFSLNTMGGDFIRGGQKVLGFYKDMASEMININSQFDSIGATFKTVYGDLANEKLDWAMDFSIKTPFQVKDTTRAMSGLHAIGLDVTQQVKSATGEMVPLLQAMGDLSTRNTGARGGISGMMEAVSNLYGGDGGRSLRARFDLPKTYVDELKEAVDQGGDIFAQKFADLANQLTPNAMQNMIGTWEQVIAEMEDTWDMFVWKIGKAGAFDTAKQTLKDIAGALGNLASNDQAIQSISNVFQAIWKPIDLVAKGIIKATEAITDFVVKHPKLSEFIGTGVAIGGAMMVATGTIMKMAGSVVVLGASIASLYLNFKLVKGLNLVGEFDFIFKAVGRGLKSFTTWGLVLGGFALAFKGRFGDLGNSGKKVANTLQTAWSKSNDILKNGLPTIDQLSNSWNIFNRATREGVNGLIDVNKQYDSLTLKLTRLRLIGTVIGRSLFGSVIDGEIKYTQVELDNLNTLGLMPIAQTFAIIRSRVDSFISGVTEGIGVAIDICKKFFDIVSKPFTAFFDAFDSKLKPIGEAFKSIFGIKGLEGMELTKAEKQIEMFRQLGEVAGKLMGTLLAFKVIKTVTSFITSPFIALGKHITNATNKLTGFKNSFTGLFGNKNKIRVANGLPSLQPEIDPKTEKKFNKQKQFQKDFMVPHRILGSTAIDTVEKKDNKSTVKSTHNVTSTNGKYTDTRRVQTLPQTTYKANTNPFKIPTNYLDSSTSTRIPTTRPTKVVNEPMTTKVPVKTPIAGTNLFNTGARIPVPNVRPSVPVNDGAKLPTSPAINLGNNDITGNLREGVKAPVNGVTKAIKSLERTTEDSLKASNQTVVKLPVGATNEANSGATPKQSLRTPAPNVRNMTDNRVNTNSNAVNSSKSNSNAQTWTDNRVNTNTNTNTITRTNASESISTRMYEKGQFKKIDGRFFNSKTPWSQRDFGDATGYTLNQSSNNSYTTPKETKAPIFGQPETKYMNVTNREAFENRFITPQKPTMENTRITSPKFGAKGYSLDHSFIEEQGYRFEDYTNSKTRKLTGSEKDELEQARRKKLTSGKMGGAWNKYFKVKDRVGKFMDVYDDTPRLTGEQIKLTGKSPKTTSPMQTSTQSTSPMSTFRNFISGQNRTVANNTSTSPVSTSITNNTQHSTSPTSTVRNFVSGQNGQGVVTGNNTNTTPQTRTLKGVFGSHTITPSTVTSQSINQAINSRTEKPKAKPSQRGTFSRVYSAYTSDRYNDFIAEGRGTNKNQTYVKNRSKLGARLFGHQYYEKDINTGEMKKAGKYGGRFGTDRDDKQTKLAVEKLSSKSHKQRLNVAKPKASDYRYVDENGISKFDREGYKEASNNRNSGKLNDYKPTPMNYYEGKSTKDGIVRNVFNAKGYRESITKQPNTGSQVMTMKNLTDPRAKNVMKVKSENFKGIGANQTVYEANRSKLANTILGKRYYTEATDSKGNMVEHTVARKGGLINKLSGHQNRLVVKDEGDVSLKGRVNKVADPIKAGVSHYTPKVVKQASGAVVSGASRAIGSTVALGNTVASAVTNNKVVRGARGLVNDVKDTNTYKAVANTRVGKAVGSTVKAVTTKDGIKGTTSRAGNLLFGRMTTQDIYERDSNGKIVEENGQRKVAGTKAIRRGGLAGAVLGNKTVNEDGSVNKRSGGARGFLLGNKMSQDVYERDETGKVVRDANGDKRVAGTRAVRRGGVVGAILGNKSVNDDGTINKRSGGVAGVVKGTAKGVGKAVGGAGKVAGGAVRGVGKVAGGAVKGVGKLAGGALRMAPMAMMGMSLGSVAYDSIKEKGGGDFTKGLEELKKQTKNIDFSGMWDGVVAGAKEILPIIGSIFKNVFQNLSRDLPNILSNAWEGLKAGASLAWNWIQSDGLALLGGLFSKVGELATQGWEWIKTDGLAMLSGFADYFITDIVPKLIEGIFSFCGWFKDEGLPILLDVLKNLIQFTVTDFVPKMIIGIVGMVGSMGEAIWTGITTAWDNVLVWCGNLWDTFIANTIKTLTPKFLEDKVLGALGYDDASIDNKKQGRKSELEAKNKSRPDESNKRKEAINNFTTNAKDTVNNFNNSRNTEKVHHGGLWLSENEHRATIRKDETVLPPSKSKKLDEVLNSVSTGSKAHAPNQDQRIVETGDSINIQKVEVVVQAEKLSKSDAKAQAMQVIDEIKRLNKRNNIKNFVY